VARTDCAAPGIRIGTAGWSYRDWDGILYPPEVTRKKVHPVEFLARFFDVIEINTSFYGHIRRELGRLWSRKAAAANPNFLFTAKALVKHYPELKEMVEIEDASGNCSLLG
jgi:uncharacterized protein YecE (DUF72 family)